MTRPPDRIPPSPEKRLRTRLNAQPGLAEGLSRNLRPVQPRAGGSGRSQQPVSVADLPRVMLVTGFSDADYVDMVQPTAKYPLDDLVAGADWGIDEDEGRGVITYDEGGVYLHQPGIYSVALILNTSNIEDADPDCSVRLGADISDPVSTGFSCVTRGGDVRTGGADLTCASRTYYDPGNGFSGGIFPWFMYQNLDMTVVTNVAGLVQVQQIVAG